ncbi:MAG: enoyl-CoA hydratase/isomerase family protein, partial [Alphaproteobacteria bacterium]|nr:enoyl-CoA hydratase/isomerase family protein [Alphaproteobacteria bacterium]
MQHATKNAELAGLEDWRYEIDNENIAWAIFDRKGESVNALGKRPLEELGRIVEHAEAAANDGRIAGLIIMSGKKRGFIVGADIREFELLDSEDKVVEAVSAVNLMLDHIEAMKVPTVCAIHGNCLGGGLELALACDYRVATRDDSTRVGFPEVKLGIFPGFNGTARSIRQAGPVAAMQAMLTGRMIRAGAARAMGLIDELVASPHRLRWAARKAVLRKRKSKPAGPVKRLMAQWPARGMIVKKMRTETAKKVREDHYPAPFRLIDLFEQY